nr:hypothetical protein [Aromatoleum toluolicum]
MEAALRGQPPAIRSLRNLEVVKDARQLPLTINRRATQMKVLYWDRSGFCIWAKRLESGRFVSDWSRTTSREM